MSIRKSVAHQLINAAKALENDKSKENIKTMINVGRIKLANAIMPNIPPIKRGLVPGNESYLVTILTPSAEIGTAQLE